MSNDSREPCTHKPVKTPAPTKSLAGTHSFLKLLGRLLAQRWQRECQNRKYQDASPDLPITPPHPPHHPRNP